MTEFAFNAHAVRPHYANDDELPVGKHRVVVAAHEYKPAKNDGGFIALTLKAIDGRWSGGEIIDRLNLHNDSKLAVRMASERLTAYMHVCGFVDLSAQDFPKLYNKPFVVDVRERKDGRGNEVKKVLPAPPVWETPRSAPPGASITVALATPPPAAPPPPATPAPPQTNLNLLPPFRSSTVAESTNARLAPDCIVQDHYFADVAMLAGEGGVSKTTLVLDQLVNIVLGLPLYGQEVRKPGPVAFLTAEDSEETLRARLREICNARLFGGAPLTSEQMEVVMRDVRICDARGLNIRLTQVKRDTVQPNYPILDALLTMLGSFQPVALVVDPAVSFGVGEGRVNDAEQALIDAGRYLVRKLGCLVLYIHHTGKTNAQNKEEGQYGYRGGSAFADGSRMRHNLLSLSPAEYKRLTRRELAADETAMILPRPKMSYTRSQPPIIIVRSGFRFSYVPKADHDAAAKMQGNANTVLAFIRTEVEAARYPTQNSVTAMTEILGLTVREIRDAIHMLKASNLLDDRKPPYRPGGKGGSRNYLHPIGVPDFEPPLSQQS